MLLAIKQYRRVYDTHNRQHLPKECLSRVVSLANTAITAKSVLYHMWSMEVLILRSTGPEMRAEGFRLESKSFTFR